MGFERIHPALSLWRSVPGRASHGMSRRDVRVLVCTRLAPAGFTRVGVKPQFVRHCSYYSGLNVNDYIFVCTLYLFPAFVGAYPVYRFVGSLQQYSSSPGRAGEIYGQWNAEGWGMDAELIDTCVREKFTKYNSPLGSWHLSVSAKVSLAVS